MELRTLRAFVEVVRQGGFTEAAKVVFATQSTVSKAVKQLEDELGVRLLDRVGHRSTLTSAGDIVYRRALTMLTERDDLLAELDDLHGLKRGTLRLGLPRIGGDALFAPMFAAYRDRYPNIDVQLVEHGSERLEEVLRAGEVDLAGLLLPNSEEFDWQELRREPIVALIAEDHPLAAAGNIALRDLADLPFILFDAGFALTPIILEACKQSGFVPRIIARSSQIGFILELAADGLGVAFLPRLIADLRRHERLRPIAIAEPLIEWRMALAWRRGGYLSQAARAWLDLAKDMNRHGVTTPSGVVSTRL